MKLYTSVLGVFIGLLISHRLILWMFLRHVKKVGKACRRNGRRRAPNRAIINGTSTAESDGNDLCDVKSDDSLTFGENKIFAKYQ